MPGPVAVGSNIPGSEDSLVIGVTLAATDSGAGSMSFQVTDLPAHGTLLTDFPGSGVPVTPGMFYNGVFDAGSGHYITNFVFVPDPDWSGSTSFHFSATDGNGRETGIATEVIDVAGVADAPIIDPNVDEAPTPVAPAIQITNGLAAVGPAVADLGGGKTLVVWQQGVGTPSHIMAQVYDANGSVGAAFEVTPAGGDDEVQPKVATQADGGFAITWVQDDPGFTHGDIHAAFFAAGATIPTRVVTTAATAGGTLADPIVAAVGNGYVIVFAMENGTGADMVAQRYDADGNTVGGFFPVSANASGNGTGMFFDPPEHDLAALGTDGSFVLVTNHGGQIDADLFDAANFSTHIVVDTVDGVDPVVTALAGGGFVVVWQFDDGGGNEDVYGRLYDGFGNPTSGVLHLIEDFPLQFTPDVAALPDGRFALAWTANNGTGGTYDIFTQTFAADGTPSQGDPLNVSATGTPTYEGQPSIVAHDDGTFTIAWHNPGLRIETLDAGPAAVHGDAGTPIDLPATFALTDTDGSERLQSVTIDGVPPGWTFNAGAPGGPGTWVVDRSTPAESAFLDGLAAGTVHFVVTPPSDFGGSHTFQFDAVSEEIASGTTASSNTAFVPMVINPVMIIDLNGSDPGNSISLSFAENDPLTQIAPGATVIDPNSSNFDGALLTVTITSGGAADDLLRFLNTGGVVFDEGQIYYDGNFIATGGGGTDPIDPLVIVFNDQADLTGIQAVVDAIGFVNYSDSPVGGDRVITYSLTDGDGNVSIPTDATVTVVPVEDAPVALPDQIYVSEDLVQAGNVFADNGNGNDSDPDGPALVVSEVNGSAANVGQAIVTAGGGIVRISANGNFSFDPHGAYQSLWDGQSAQEQVTYTLAGGNTVTVDFTVQGANDAPTFPLVAGDLHGATLTESNSGLAASGSLTVVDPDTTDTVALSKGGVGMSGTTTGLGLDNAALLAMFTVSPTAGRLDADAGDTHNVSWSFDSLGQAFDYLDDGESLTLAYFVRATDLDGATGNGVVSITINGTNDGPSFFFGGGDADGGLPMNETNSALVRSGTMTATDPDLSDSVTSSVVGVVASGTTAGLSSSNADLAAMMHLTANVAADPGSANNVHWTFDSGAQAFDYLAAGQALNLAYQVRVTDDSGASDDEYLFFTILGTNDAPTIGPVSAPLGAVSELPDHDPGENVATLSAGGTIHFHDPDVPDNVHSAYVADLSGNYLGSFALDAVDQANDTVGWSFQVPDAELNGLGQGQVVKQYYNVTIDDGHGGVSSQVVEIDLVGTNDRAILSSANVFVEQGASPVTNSGTLTITDEDNPALFVPQGSTAGHWGHFSVDENGHWSYTADQVYSLSAGQFRTDVFTVVAADATPTTVAVTITGHDLPAMAQQDLFSTSESALLGAGLNLFANNGSGLDTDPDGALQVAAVNGVAGNVGHSLLLASGARVIVNADGTFSYDPNHAFDWLTPAVGAANQFGYDSFTYTLAGGTTATVFVNIAGEESPGDLILGNALDNVVFGLAGNDSFRLEQGGSDTVYGSTGNDGFYFGAALDSGDKVDGGDGTDTLAIQGNTHVSLGDIGGVEVLVALSGSDASFGDTAGNHYAYDLTTRDSNVGADQTLTVIGTGLQPGENLAFDGSAETDGNFRIFAGQGTDDLTGGAGSDGFFFGADGNLTGADHVDGGAGVDSLALRGNYVGANAVVFRDGSLADVEVMALLSGHTNEYSGQIVPGGFDYDVTLANGNVAAGQHLDVAASLLGADESIRFDGRAETDGFFRIFAGAGNDTLYGGSGGDMLYGGLGADALEGGAGADSYVYLSAAESTSTGYDAITGFDWHVDRIDAPGGARAFGQAASGSLSTASFDADLSAGLDGVLAAGQAALFTANAGTLSGHVFAVIDVNGVAGYQAGADLVIELVDPVTPIDSHAAVIA